jgi:uncharacterized membrane protein
MEGEAHLVKSGAITVSAILAAIGLPALAQGQDRVVAPTDFKPQECYGIAKARQNDCQTLTHACAGLATSSKDKDSWIYLPAGTCQKIVGGSITPKA